MGRSHQHRTRRVSGAAVLVAAAWFGACSGDDGGGDPEAVGAATYVAVIDEFLPPSDIAPDEDADRPVVYVAPLNDPLSLEDQVAVIDTVAERVDLRFVDDLSAAFVSEDDDADTRDGALVLAVGRIPAEPPHTVRVEVYADIEDVRAELVTVVVDGTDADGSVAWRVDHVEQVEPEGLVGDE